MKLLFFGDMAVPDRESYQDLKKMIEDNKLFENKIVIGNLEGLITEEDEALEKYQSHLFNQKYALDLFEKSKKSVLTLANNHIKDIEEVFKNTEEELTKRKIGYVGASLNKEDVNKPYELMDEGKKYAIFSHCWEVMGKIIENKSNKIFLNEKPYEKLLEDVKKYKEENKDATIIVCLHWNFDFEILPFPSHRKLGKELIDNGATYVIGGHSHVINGGERYKKGIIIYGMGNFYIPSNKFFKGKLNYKAEAKKQIILEIDDENNKVKSFYVDDKQIVEEDFDTGNFINKYSPYRNMNEKEYVKYFRKNRIKKLAIPIYINNKNNFTNKLKNLWIINRMRLFRKLKNIK